MTLIVATPEMIIADCRLTIKIDVHDANEKLVQTEGLTLEFAKIGEWHVTQDGDVSEAFALFGDVETAKALATFIRTMGGDDLPRKLEVLGMFNPKIPKTESGVVWLNEKGVVHWAKVSSDGFEVANATDDTPHAFGSGAELFRKHLDNGKSVPAAFFDAAREDPMSTYEYCDRYLRSDGSVTRFDNRGMDTERFVHYFNEL